MNTGSSAPGSMLWSLKSSGKLHGPKVSRQLEGGFMVGTPLPTQPQRTESRTPR